MESSRRGKLKLHIVHWVRGAVAKIEGSHKLYEKGCEEAEEWLVEERLFPGHKAYGNPEELPEPHGQSIEPQELEQPVEYEDDTDGMVLDIQEKDGDEATAAEAA